MRDSLVLVFEWFAVMTLLGSSWSAKMDELEKECQKLEKEIDELMAWVAKGLSPHRKIGEAVSK